MEFTHSLNHNDSEEYILAYTTNGLRILTISGSKISLSLSLPFFLLMLVLITSEGEMLVAGNPDFTAPSPIERHDVPKVATWRLGNCILAEATISARDTGYEDTTSWHQGRLRLLFLHSPDEESQSYLSLSVNF